MPQPLKPLGSDFPMDGLNLIEASAGTGKTYSIQTLFLRLVITCGYDVRKILVVTFTEAAAKELRDRLRQILQSAARFAQGQLDEADDDHARIRELMSLPLPDVVNADDVRASRLRRALLDFDQAPIWTIHGFCHRVLNRYAFECRHAFDAELMPSTRKLVDECCCDWWRQHVYHASEETAELLGETKLKLKNLQKMVALRLAKPDARMAADSGVSAIIDSIAETCRARKTEQRLMDYSDLLLNVRDALANEAAAPDHGLLQALTDDFEAALIDEFQDTDPVQYEIFARAFIGSGTPVFLVGDPKQAIYRFRNGDIFTYYAATDAVDGDRHYSLDCNYRSETNLVDAVNAIFKSDTADWHAFKRDKIHYDGTLAAQGKDADRSLCVDGSIDEEPFKLWVFDEEIGKPPPGLDTDETRSVFARTAEEIVRLLTDEKLTIAGRRVVPGDIAILVTAHSEATRIAAELRRRDVPVVQQSTGNVFDTLEAGDLALLLRAMAEPGNLSAVRAALATDLFDLTHAELRAVLDGRRIRDGQPTSDGDSTPHTFADYVLLFRRAHDRWQRSSFIVAFNHVAGHAGLRRSLAAGDHGERRLTNVLHLAELLHRSAVENRFGMESLLNWLAAQRAADTREQDDAYEMRLETDAAAVRIMTVFKSKGLQFPIVFVPTMWRHKLDFRRDAMLEYHAEPAAAAAATEQEPPAVPGASTIPLLLEPDKNASDAKAKAKQEKLEESLRLVYVAVTRAIHRAYLVTGRLNAPGGALDHLFEAEDADALEALLQARSGQTRLPIELVRQSFAQPEVTTYVPSASAAVEDLAPPMDLPYVDKGQGHTSFTAISPHATGTTTSDDDRYDFDQEDTPADVEAADDAEAAPDIFSFAAGAHTGQCWHAIFEALDFTADNDVVRDVVDEQMRIFGLDHADTDDERRQKQEIVCGMVRATLEATLPGPDHGLCLHQVTPGDCLAEMEFNVPLSREKRHTGVILDVLQRHWAEDPDRTAFLAALANWETPIPRGFMTGFIDLVFQHNGRYFILDWKSNQLDGTPESFNHERIQQEMAAHAYFLQYLFYAVALHLHLQHTLPEYRCADHFGGVYYVFLRGTQAGGDRGVYYDRPAPELIEDLTRTLLDGTGGPVHAT